MFSSIYDDLKRNVRSGNMITRIILVNVFLFVIMKLIFVFTFFGNSAQASPIHGFLLDQLVISSNLKTLITHPWTLFTHFFMHEGFFHLGWNMLLLYWFGSIVGDFLNDKRILPIYLLGGLAGALFFVLSDIYIPGGSGGNAVAMGASAAVMAMIFVAATISPDYYMHLLLIGPVKIKYIALFILFLDIVGTAGASNTGGHFGHLGGAFMGMLIVYMMRRGTDITLPISSFFDKIVSRFEEDKEAKNYAPKLELVHVSKSKIDNDNKPSRSKDYQKRLDEILDKINSHGYEKLDDEEKEFLFQASKKD